MTQSVRSLLQSFLGMLCVVLFANASQAQATDPWVSQPEVDGSPALRGLLASGHNLSCSGGATTMNIDQDIQAQLSMYVDGVEVGGDLRWGIQPTVIVNAFVAYSENARPISCELYAPGTSAQASGTILPVCDDNPESLRTVLKREYHTIDTGWIPYCSSFTDNGGSAHFSWSELNGGFSTGNPHSPYGMIHASLTSGLEDTRTNYNNQAITLTSGYRCPHGNQNAGGVSNSNHTRGTAADMKVANWNFAAWDTLRIAALAAGATEIEPYAWAPDHLHAGW